jgi:hypothetical protein
MWQAPMQHVIARVRIDKGNMILLPAGSKQGFLHCLQGFFGGWPGRDKMATACDKSGLLTSQALLQPSLTAT